MVVRVSDDAPWDLDDLDGSFALDPTPGSRSAWPAPEAALATQRWIHMNRCLIYICIYVYIYILYILYIYIIYIYILYIYIHKCVCVCLESIDHVSMCM